MDSFYLPLPSNGISVSNGATNGSYTTEFTDGGIVLPEGETWEVALTDIQVPKTFSAVANDSTEIIRLYITDEAMQSGDTKWWTLTPAQYIAEHNNIAGRSGRVSDHSPLFSRESLIRAFNMYHWNAGDKYVSILFNKGAITSVDSLVAYIAHAAHVIFHDATYSLMLTNIATTRVQYYLNKKISRVLFIESTVNEILGILPVQATAALTQTYELDTKIYEGKYEPDLNNGVNTIFVYSDIVDMQRMHKTDVQLLRTVPFNDTKIERPQYKRVIRNSFNTIEITLTDLAGRPIKFARGITICTLHFRRRPL